MDNSEQPADKQARFFQLENHKPFAESLIWELNRNYYLEKGITAWSSGEVPHQITSNSKVGKTYAEIIFGFLKDLAYKGKTTETVYILEVGAGHGRLAFHTLKHLDKLIAQIKIDLPPFCYVLSDIAEDNLTFFAKHPQFQAYFEKGVLDVAYFDIVSTQEIQLRIAKKTLQKSDLKQPILVLANYFFDSIPQDLYFIKDKKIDKCTIALSASLAPETVNTAQLLENIELDYALSHDKSPFYEQAILNDILEEYRELLINSFFLFPEVGLRGLENLKGLSSEGLMLISMDKGNHEIHNLESLPAPQMMRHGSMSFSVNYHALGSHCQKMGGTTWFPQSSNFHLEVACLLYLPDGETYTDTRLAYQRYVDDFGPDDYNSVKKLAYKHLHSFTIQEIVAFLRISAYDSSLFIKILPRLKQLISTVTYNERLRVAETMRQTWDGYFSMNNANDLGFEMAGLFYELAYYADALTFFEYSENLFGTSADGYYNKILCYYQLRQDDLFAKTLKQAKLEYPNFEKFKHLDDLDLNAM